MEIESNIFELTYISGRWQNIWGNLIALNFLDKIMTQFFKQESLDLPGEIDKGLIREMLFVHLCWTGPYTEQWDIWEKESVRLHK